jgi:hypothetical protein
MGGNQATPSRPFLSVTFIARKSLPSGFSEFVPLPEQFPDVQTNGWLNLELALEGEDVRDDPALSPAVGLVVGVERPLDGHERIVKFAL